MSITIPNVQPGQLIKADDWNNLVAQLIALDARVSSLEAITPGSGNAFAITGLSQTSPHVGDSLTVFGVNFGPAAQNTVWLNSNLVPTSAYDVKNSNPKQLTFTIPGIFNLPAAGGQVSMQITTPNGSDQRQFFVLPAVITVPNGTLVMPPPQWQNAGNVGAGKSMLTFNVTALVSAADTYTVAASTTFPGATATAVDGSGKAIIQVQLPAMKLGDVPIPIAVQLVIPDGTTSGSGTVSLDLTSTTNPQGVTGGSSQSQTFSVGSAPPDPGNVGFSFALGRFSTATITGTKITVPAGNTAGLLTTSLILPPNAPTGTYTVSATFDGAGWTALLGTNTASGSFAVSFAGGTAAPTFGLTVIGTAGAASTTMTLSVTHATNALFFGHKPFTVALA